jgi:hypothetical protein
MKAVIDFLHTPMAATIGLYLLTLFGTTAAYVFGLMKGFEGSVAFLRNFFPNRSDLFYTRVDFFLVCLIGSLLGIIIFQPRATIEAIAAGFGWVSGIEVLLARNSKVATRGTEP